MLEATHEVEDNIDNYFDDSSLRSDTTVEVERNETF